MTTSPLASPAATRDVLERYGLATKHRLGQNFLVDNHVIERIMALAALDGDARVLEVGPGIGTLTLALVQEAGAVVAVEMDRTLEPVLEEHAAGHPNLAYILGDALKVAPEELAAAYARIAARREGRLSAEGGAPDAAPLMPDILVANLPYNVAATLILQLLTDMPSLKAAVVMVQKEVADRIAAEPGTKAYGAYTAKLGMYGRVVGRFEVPPRCFRPAPHVDSAVVRIERWGVGEAPDAALHDPAFRARCASVMEAAFAQRRKTIRNSMGASGFDKARLDAAFAAAGIAPTARAERLSTADFAHLARALDAAGADEAATA